MLSAAKHLVAGLETFSPLAWKSVCHVERSETSRNELGDLRLTRMERSLSC